jgi:hypothetical protein
VLFEVDDVAAMAATCQLVRDRNSRSGAVLRSQSMERTWTLIGADGRPYVSRMPGTLGGHRRSRIYGRLDCPSALRWIARGHYVRHRVFFADETTAKAARYRPCAVCLPHEYLRWRGGAPTVRAEVAGPTVGSAT